LLAAFGVGNACSKEVEIVKMPPSLTIRPGTVALITGNSGSGKSSLIPLLVDAWPKPSTISTGSMTHELPLIDLWVDSAKNNVAKLSAVGLGDAFLWPRTIDEISDGQRARLEAADLLFGPGDLVIIDEFLNALDRVTAKAVAWSIGQLARRLGKACIFVTSIEDIRYDLGPDLHLHVGVDSEPAFVWSEPSRSCCSLHDSLTYRTGDFNDWKALKKLHYAAGDPATVHSVHVLDLDGLDHPAAVMVLSYPNLHSAPRNLALKGHFNIGSSLNAAQRLNQEMLLLSRIVVAPEVRTCGLAKRLIVEALKTVDARWIECSTAMGRYNRFLLNCGFVEVPQALHKVENEWIDFGTQVMLDGRDGLDGARLMAAVDALSVRKARKGRQIVWSLYHHFVLHRRTHDRRPERTADLTDPRWVVAFDLAARRIHDRPAYFILETEGIRGATWRTPVNSP